MIRRAVPSEDWILSALAMRSKAHWPYPKGYLEKCIDALRVSADDIRSWSQLLKRAIDEAKKLYRSRAAFFAH